MRRSLIILVAVVISSMAMVGLSSLIARRICVDQLVNRGDELAWFRREFRLNEAELAHIRQLHEGYLPKCRQMCDRIVAKKKDLQTALDAGKGLTPDAERILVEVGALRAQCQIQMLRHFDEVSQAMPPEQGRRYLAEMRELTLGFHERFERTMSADPAAPHGHR
jgi:hypothetical protein